MKRRSNDSACVEMNTYMVYGRDQARSPIKRELVALDWFPYGKLIYNYLMEKVINSAFKLQQYYELTGLSGMFPAHNIIVVLVK